MSTSEVISWVTAAASLLGLWLYVKDSADQWSALNRWRRIFKFAGTWFWFNLFVFFVDLARHQESLVFRQKSLAASVALLVLVEMGQAVSEWRGARLRT